MNRSLNPSEHDDIVRTHALRLLSEGYEVYARIEGWFEQPEIIAGYRPDIIARKNTRSLILEVEKGAIDWPKITAFQQFVSTHPEYELTIISPAESELRKTGT